MKRVAWLALLQAGVILGWAGWNERVLATAPTFRIPLQPVDPYDVLRGRYFILNPEDRRIQLGAGTRLPSAELRRAAGDTTGFHGTAFVGFCADGALHRICALARMKEEADGRAAFWSRARVFYTAGAGGDIDLGLDRFFIPNRAQLPAAERDQGWELELAHRPGLTPLPKRLFFRGTPVVSETTHGSMLI